MQIDFSGLAAHDCTRNEGFLFTGSVKINGKSHELPYMLNTCELSDFISEMLDIIPDPDNEISMILNELHPSDFGTVFWYKDCGSDEPYKTDRHNPQPITVQIS